MNGTLSISYFTDWATKAQGLESVTQHLTRSPKAEKECQSLLLKSCLVSDSLDENGVRNLKWLLTTWCALKRRLDCLVSHWNSQIIYEAGLYHLVPQPLCPPLCGFFPILPSAPETRVGYRGEEGAPTFWAEWAPGAAALCSSVLRPGRPQSQPLSFSLLHLWLGPRAAG